MKYKNKNNILLFLLFLINLMGLIGCQQANNNPHPENHKSFKVFYSSFGEQPKTLDPAKSYSSNEAAFTANIYEPPLEYDYLKRPYELVPLTAEEFPKIEYLNSDFHKIPDDSSPQKIAYTSYTIHIKPGILYQPHPAFAKTSSAEPLYFNLKNTDLKSILTPYDFPVLATRELTANDYVYEIKRLAFPHIQSPIAGVMQEHIYGFKNYAEQLNKLELSQKTFIDLNQYPFKGAQVINKYTYKIIINGVYPQFKYWLAMPFFAPVPWEADKFYSQAVLKKKNMTLDQYPVGTGPYYLAKNEPNREMILRRNSYFHPQYFPKPTNQEDVQYAKNAGELLPLIDEVHFALEKESIPRWIKFLQGYYDQSAIGAEQYENVVQLDTNGNPHLTPEMQKQNLNLQTIVSPAIFYLGFNMKDDIVGGYSERARKLRRAIAIAVDFNEFISIFLNGRGIEAQSPIPIGIFGAKANQYNSYLYYKNSHNELQRYSIEKAKKLLAEAGYPGGMNPKTGEPLILYFDTALAGGPDDKAQLAWYREQFAKLGIDLQFRATQYNQFQEKMRKGNSQIFAWGWQADYPDPENFLFLLYGPNSQVAYGGENTANYQNKEYDTLFKKMKNLPDSPERKKVIAKMLDIVERDGPWIWGFYPKTFILSHQWMEPLKLHAIANNTLKYMDLNPELRQNQLHFWNRPIIFPLFIFLILGVFIVLCCILFYRHLLFKKQKRYLQNT